LTDFVPLGALGSSVSIAEANGCTSSGHCR
jgi:hypothetical protein